MSRRGTAHLEHELDLLLERFRHEYVMTGAELVGVLEFQKAKILNEILNVQVDDGDEE